MTTGQITEYLKKYNVKSKEDLSIHIKELKKNTYPNYSLISELVYTLEDSSFFKLFSAKLEGIYPECLGGLGKRGKIINYSLEKESLKINNKIEERIKTADKFKQESIEQIRKVITGRIEIIDLFNNISAEKNNKIVLDNFRNQLLEQDNSNVNIVDIANLLTAKNEKKFFKILQNIKIAEKQFKTEKKNTMQYLDEILEQSNTTSTRHKSTSGETHSKLVFNKDSEIMKEYTPSTEMMSNSKEALLSQGASEHEIVELDGIFYHPSSNPCLKEQQILRARGQHIFRDLEREDTVLSNLKFIPIISAEKIEKQGVKEEQVFRDWDKQPIRYENIGNTAGVSVSQHGIIKDAISAKKTEKEKAPSNLNASVKYWCPQTKSYIEEKSIYEAGKKEVEYPKSPLECFKGIKETENKADYSEINLNILDLMADRFNANKHKYEKGNMLKPIDVKSLEWAAFRHIKKMLQPIKDDPETYKEHLASVLCNISMILNQLEIAE